MVEDALRSGELDHEITIESASESRTSTGAVTSTWGTFVTCWAKVEPLSGSELDVAAAMQGETMHRVTIRHEQGITPKMRVNLGGGRYLDILSTVNVRERNRVLVLNCKEAKYSHGI